MSCQVCGDPDSTYYSTKRQSLCRCCSKGTPAKVSRSVFDKRYWVSDDPDEALPCEAIKRDFYEDYLRSEYTLAGYIEQTISAS